MLYYFISVNLSRKKYEQKCHSFNKSMFVIYVII